MIIYVVGHLQGDFIMFLIIVLFIIASIIVWLETISGKIAIGFAVVAIGFLLLNWITGISFLLILVKVSAAIIVITIIVVIVLSIIG